MMVHGESSSKHCCEVELTVEKRTPLAMKAFGVVVVVVVVDKVAAAGVGSDIDAAAVVVVVVVVVNADGILGHCCCSNDVLRAAPSGYCCHHPHWSQEYQQQTQIALESMWIFSSRDLCCRER